MDKGFVIAFEGGEGSGKSTALPIFANLLKDKGFKVKTYAEPGGTDYAQAIRPIFFDHPNMSVKTAVHLMNSQRQDNIDTIIKPYIEDGYIVLIDRFVTSTMVYQGILSDHLGDLDGKAEQLDWVLSNSITHDHVVFFFDCPPEVSMGRVVHRDGNNHFDDMSLDKHRVIYEGYKNILNGMPGRTPNNHDARVEQVVKTLCTVPYVPGCLAVNTIDACDSIDGVTQQLEACVQDFVHTLTE